VKTEGDAFMVSFQHATQALGFAIDSQLRLHQAKWPEFLLNVHVSRLNAPLLFLLSLCTSPLLLFLLFPTLLTAFWRLLVVCARNLGLVTLRACRLTERGGA